MLLLQSKDCFGRDSALCAAGGGVQIGRRAGAAIVSVACKFRVAKYLSRKAAHRSQALCRVLAGAE